MSNSGNIFVATKETVLYRLARMEQIFGTWLEDEVIKPDRAPKSENSCHPIARAWQEQTRFIKQERGYGYIEPPLSANWLINFADDLDKTYDLPYFVTGNNDDVFSRLKNQKEFAGASYEINVAHRFVRAGYGVEFIYSTETPKQKAPDLLATSPEGMAFVVECKRKEDYSPLGESIKKSASQLRQRLMQVTEQWEKPVQLQFVYFGELDERKFDALAEMVKGYYHRGHYEPIVVDRHNCAFRLMPYDSNDSTIPFGEEGPSHSGDSRIDLKVEPVVITGFDAYRLTSVNSTVKEGGNQVAKNVMPGIVMVNLDVSKIPSQHIGDYLSFAAHGVRNLMKTQPNMVSVVLSSRTIMVPHLHEGRKIVTPIAFAYSVHNLGFLA